MYDKTLKLSTWVMNEGGMTPGQIMNHMSVDPLNICLFFYLSHFTWALGMQVGALVTLQCINNVNFSKRLRRNTFGVFGVKVSIPLVKLVNLMPFSIHISVTKIKCD